MGSAAIPANARVCAFPYAWGRGFLLFCVMHSLLLHWRGPVGAGCFPVDLDGLDALAVPAGYLRLKVYANGRVIAYAEQSTNLLSRIDQPLTRLLSFAQPLRDEDGDAWFSATGEARFESYIDGLIGGPSMTLMPAEALDAD